MSVVVGRSRVATKYGIVAASQPLAARAGVQVLERGGNAVDAAIATNAVMGLVEPQSNGIGGDLFAIVYEAKTGQLHGLNSHGWAPRTLTPALLKSHGLIDDAVQRHSHRDGAGRRRRVGRASRAARHAADGRAPRRGDLLRGRRVSRSRTSSPRTGPTLTEKLERSPAPGRRTCPAAGRRAPARCSGIPISPARCALIAAHGRAGFYEGRPPTRSSRSRARRAARWPPPISREFEPEWVEPISTTYRGWTVYELPPSTQGIAALMMLNLMEPFPLADYGFHSAKALHVMIEAKKLAYADMLRYVGDTRFATVPVAAMLDKALARERAGCIDPARPHAASSRRSSTA